ncbi:GAP family protein [Streptomyces sp. NPDC057249]|uniref:GAP family protein n=1 Tax=Streptomyces sp. NPDC057249 TaxID=3346067 RepID=UPI00362CCB89
MIVLPGSGADVSQGAGGPAAWTLWLELALGVLFLLMGVKQWKDRPREGRDTQPSDWMKAIDRFTPAKAAGLAAALAVANPKNLVLAVGGAVSIASSTATTGGKTIAAALMVLTASLCTLLPLAVYLFDGTRSPKVLGEWKAWMAAHNAAIMTPLFLVLGAKYVGDTVSGLTT